jgi:hypothetical protein
MVRLKEVKSNLQSSSDSRIAQDIHHRGKKKKKEKKT